jgi:multidrug efflux pump subunit AcrA (membrane-fusion protein)
MFTNTKAYIRAHKAVSITVLVLLAIGGYYAYRDSNTATAVTKYVVEDATQGSVISDVAGTGQVQAGTTINVAAKVSEDVTSIPVTIGEHVTEGQLLVQLDPTNEERALQQAQLSLQQAQLSAEQTDQVATTTLLQQQDSVTTAEQSLANASTSLVEDYQTGFNNLGATFVNLQTLMIGLQDFVSGNDVSKTQEDPDAFVSLMPDYLQAGVTPYKTTFESEYQLAVTAYQQSLSDYHAASATSDTQTLDALFAETNNTAQTISATVKAGKNFLDYIVNTYPAASSTKPLPTITNTFETDFGNYTNTIASQIAGVQSSITTISNDRNAIVNAQDSLTQASETLSETLAGPTQTTLLSQQISLESAQNALQTAQENLDYTSVRAPISGVVSAIGAIVGETGGSNAVTIVGDGEVALITLNEINAAKVNLGDQATLTFDAIPNLSLAGQVVEIDPVGTVSQGVVSYNVQVGFSQPSDTSSSDLVKPGMSTSVNIVTQADQNVIAVPNAAVVTSGGSSYILEPANPLSAAQIASSASGGIVLPAIKEVPVTLGLSNNTQTEVTSGINVGDQIIVQTIKSTTAAKTTATTGSSALQLLGGTGGAARTGGGAGSTRGAGGL